MSAKAMPLSVVADEWHGVSSQQFRRIMGAFPTGVTVITTVAEDGTQVGLTANAVSSVSLTPPQLLICLGRERYTCEVASRRGVFAVSFLGDGQQWIAERFASPVEDKFKDVSVVTGDLGMPLIEGALAHAECVIEKEIPAGDHVVFIASVRHGRAHEGSPLMFYSRQYGKWPGSQVEKDRT